MHSSYHVPHFFRFYFSGVDNIELSMATNHLGPFLLTHLLLDLVLRSDAGRIVVVSSSFHRFSCSKFPLNPIDYFYYYPALCYCNSKLANIYFTIELARRLAHSNVTVNCLHPGIVQTSIFRNALAMRMIKGIFKTAEEGAATTVYLASSPEVSKVSGKYFVECNERKLNKKYLKAAVHQKLWDDSLELVGLSSAESEIFTDVTHL
jgi:NAD(P)-dependent dehydrogenase (short-subunit alcohol dehydrogenase family)